MHLRKRIPMSSSGIPFVLDQTISRSNTRKSGPTWGPIGPEGCTVDSPLWTEEFSLKWSETRSAKSPPWGWNGCVRNTCYLLYTICTIYTIYTNLASNFNWWIRICLLFTIFIVVCWQHADNLQEEKNNWCFQHLQWNVELFIVSQLLQFSELNYSYNVHKNATGSQIFLALLKSSTNKKKTVEQRINPLFLSLVHIQFSVVTTLVKNHIYYFVTYTRNMWHTHDLLIFGSDPWRSFLNTCNIRLESVSGYRYQLMMQGDYYVITRSVCILSIHLEH